MPGWASTWARIMTVPCKPPPSNQSRVNVRIVNGEIQSRREANAREDGKGMGKALDPCAVQNRKNHMMQPSTEHKRRTTHSYTIMARRAHRVMM